MIYLVSPDKKQYKANLHCHSILSDGKKTPEELKNMYKNNGYSILAITDHERPVEHQSLSDEDFIMLTGYECYIRPDPNGKYDKYRKEVHLNLFARDPMNVSLVCFNENYSRYLKRDNAIEGLTRVGSERPREFTNEYINEYINTAKENGYLVVYNHPYWSMETAEDILGRKGLLSLEICNYGSFRVNGLEHCGAIYDKLLSENYRIFCHAADDNHNANPDHSDSFGAFTVLQPKEFTYDGIIEAMENGDMYASMGPLFQEVSFDGSKVHVKCSKVQDIFAYDGSKAPKYLHSNDGDTLTEAELDLDPNALYLRVSIRDSHGRFADTRGFFPDELGLIPDKK